MQHRRSASGEHGLLAQDDRSSMLHTEEGEALVQIIQPRGEDCKSKPVWAALGRSSLVSIRLLTAFAAHSTTELRGWVLTTLLRW